MRILADDVLFVACRPVGPFAMNQYLVACAETRRAILVDAGSDSADFLDLARRRNLHVEAIWQTHAHIDHVAGLAATRRALPDAPILMHPDDLPVLQSAPLVARMYGIPLPEPLPMPDQLLADGDALVLGNRRFEVLHTPGHAPGHVCFLDAQANLALCGDLLFRDSIGRTDLPGCDPRQMTDSLRRILTLPDATRVLPGHMDDTTIGRERRSNPFLSALRSP